MILYYRVESPERAFVHAINWVKNKIPEGVDNAVVFESLPEEESIEGKKGRLYFNPKSGAVWYEYVDRPLSDVESLRKEVEALKAEAEGLKLRLDSAESRIQTAEGKLTASAR